MVFNYEMLDWNDFRYFAALAEHGQLEAAAKDLRSSAASVFRHVHALERAIGSRLFVRRKDGHRLTQAGLALLPQVIEAKGLLERVSKSVTDKDRNENARIKILTTELGANWVLLPALARAEKQLGPLSLDIDALPSKGDLLKDELTIALRFQRPSSGDFVIKRLGSIQFQLFASKTSPWRSFTPDSPYVGWTGEFATIGPSLWLDRMFAGPAKIRLTSLAGHIAAARQGLAITGLPEFVACQFSDLRPVEDCPERFELEAWLVVPKQVRHVKAVKRASEFVTDAWELVKVAGALK